MDAEGRSGRKRGPGLTNDIDLYLARLIGRLLPRQVLGLELVGRTFLSLCSHKRSIIALANTYVGAIF